MCGVSVMGALQVSLLQRKREWPLLPCSKVYQKSDEPSLPADEHFHFQVVSDSAELLEQLFRFKYIHCMSGSFKSHGKCFRSRSYRMHGVFYLKNLSHKSFLYVTSSPCYRLHATWSDLCKNICVPTINLHTFLLLRNPQTVNKRWTSPLLHNCDVTLLFEALASKTK